MAQLLTLPREVRDALDLHDERIDPGAFFLAAFRKMSAPLRAVANRASHRARLKSVTVQDGPRRKRIRVKIRASDSPAVAAAKFAIVATRKPGIFADEALRFALGQPEGPRGLDEQLDPRIAGAMMPRGIFGIDDAILIGVVVPLLVSVLPTILPMIFQWGGDAFATVGGAVAGAPPVVDETGDDTDDEWFGFPREHVIAGAAVVVVAFFALR